MTKKYFCHPDDIEFLGLYSFKTITHCLSNKTTCHEPVKAYSKLKIFADKKFINDLRQTSRLILTSYIEAFHFLALQYQPKRYLLYVYLY